MTHMKPTLVEDWRDNSDLYMGECDGLDGGLAAGKRTCMPANVTEEERERV